MCWKMPSVQTPSIAGSQLVPKTDAKEPESPLVAGSEDTYNQKKGRQQLTIQRSSDKNSKSGYNAMNY